MEAYCYNCGTTGVYTTGSPIDDDLKKTWQLSGGLVALFNKREGSICKECGANIRAQGLAQAILCSRFGFGAPSLREWVKQANAHKLRVAEINSCHELHQTLKNLKYLTFAEYGTPAEEDIQHLSYQDNTFDLLLHSETLEHLDDPARAMAECRRVIRSDGLVLFTAPIVWGRMTRQRARRNGKKIVYVLEPSYHSQRSDDYLVYHEFGRDIDNMLGVGLCYSDWRNQNFVFFSNKVSGKISPAQKAKLRILERTAMGRKR